MTAFRPGMSTGASTETLEMWPTSQAVQAVQAQVHKDSLLGRGSSTGKREQHHQRFGGSVEKALDAWTLGRNRPSLGLPFGSKAPEPGCVPIAPAEETHNAHYLTQKQSDSPCSLGVRCHGEAR